MAPQSLLSPKPVDLEEDLPADLAYSLDVGPEASDGENDDVIFGMIDASLPLPDTDALKILERNSSDVSPSDKIKHSMSTTSSGPLAVSNSFSSASRSTGTSTHTDLVQKVTSLPNPDLLRGTPYAHVLRAQGRIFRKSQGSAQSYSLSRTVQNIDAFISHNWSVPATTKFLTLTLHFNVRFAMSCTLLVGCVICVATACGLLPIFDLAGSPEGKPSGIAATIVCPILFVVLLTGKHEIYRCLGMDGSTVFLDKTCIHQTNHELKRQGIESLSAFIEKSSSIVVVYTDEYLQKLWTVYELATFLILYPEKPVVLLPTGLVFFILSSTVALASQNILALAPLGHTLSPARLVSHLFPALVVACYMRHMARSLDVMQKTVETFSISKARCCCEEDRPLVHRNIVAFLKHSGMADVDMKDEEVLEKFDIHVRRTFGTVIRERIGTMGTQYRWMIVMILMGSGPSCLDHLGALFRRCDNQWEMAIICVELFSWHFAGRPLVMAAFAVVARNRLSARGIGEVLIMAAGVVAGFTTAVLLYLVMSVWLLHWAARASVGGFVAFVAYHVILGLVTLSIYSGWQCEAFSFFGPPARGDESQRL
eukprot:TRINITY_DN6039_c0_g2_i1.p1 TRINITY_DN6039_c0_g2~~TRINITY_DN6039_c0_g2_i1.p1  ORF type:complete len:595 (+),score=45.48 TRINITY_DN6039_c0_g2_i1:137-1921(+)